MPRRTDGEIKASLAKVASRAEERAEDMDMDIDCAVREAIEAAIDLQRQDPDLATHDIDRRVLSILHDALQEQLRDEATDTPNSGGPSY